MNSHYIIGSGRLLEIRNGRVFGTRRDLRYMRGWTLIRLARFRQANRLPLYEVTLPGRTAIEAELARMETQ